MQTYVASKNPGKIGELRTILAGSLLEIDTYEDYVEVAEDRPSYIGNALLKARALSEQLERAGIEAAVLADDSGLEVDVLGGRPGVMSARYGGKSKTWPQRRAALLGELNALPEDQRLARFICAMVLILPHEEPLTSLGIVEGRIVAKERGKSGFGYDPVFLYPLKGCTFGELSSEEKNAVSHRRRAAEGMLALLRGRA
ncbi:MAG: RdgB/HAM1 family non-canonical purine NTP pyrophosphatase [Candidatus Eremiobacteraeota bacterium]|nr:RdgB/HAM1 family non-canonical purine NTP pyrophosphatase [Candidatus Eremiobacteraeota bacterium]